ncbi:ATP-binding cassette domain-containing protein [Sphingobacterium kitahiroshimense]|uniref:ATP-binding cassette domain-containing protein n=1 Tax=Sphingobacterium sp. B16(2022) TaxID=2914044 RepID=UPI001439A08D|nr:ATP-binding cassette domain-containing protein [Sphingobacterium sp. B16(2022)]NJI72239.1 ATP-binding cassette domain-containing protein [Sphingobacterium sp. B16(2022)]
MKKLIVDNISIQFPKQSELLLNAEFYCDMHEIIGIFGRNGSGKSTLFGMIFGTEKKGSLNIKINNTLIPRDHIIPKKHIGLLPQHHFLPKSYLVKNIITLFFPSDEGQNKIFYSKRISSLESKKIGALSEGELKYLELLLIGHLDHSFLILDEPFSMVEPLYRDVIHEFLLEVKKTKGIIISDHYYNDVLNLTDRNYLIKNQQLLVVKDINDLVSNRYISP